MTNPAPEPRTRVVYPVTGLARLVTVALDRSLAEYGLSFAQYRVLFVLDTAGEASGAEISRRLDVRSPTVVGLLANLESAGLVRRLEPVGRRVPYALTAAGREAFARAAQRVDALDSHLCALLPEEHLAALENAFRLLTSEAKTVLAPPPAAPYARLTASRAADH